MASADELSIDIVGGSSLSVGDRVRVTHRGTRMVVCLEPDIAGEWVVVERITRPVGSASVTLVIRRQQPGMPVLR